MNLEPPRDQPPEPTDPVDPLDERLSAALDGFGDAAPPDAPARRRALETARDLLAVPPPPLDDVTRRRLLRTAVAASPATRSRARRDLRWLSAASVAALVLAVVGLAGWALTSLNHSSSKSSGLAASASTSPAHTLDLHEVSNPLVLERRVRAALHIAAGGNDKAAPGTTLAQPTTGTAPTSPQNRCLSSVRVDAGVTPSIFATATFHGRPALVVIAREQSRTLIFVLAATDCRLLTDQFFKD